MTGRRCTWAVAISLLWAAVGAGVAAQQPSSSPTRAEHRRLAFLVGQWEEEIQYTDGNRGRGRWQARPELGHILTFRYGGSGPEGDYRALGVLTYHAEEKTYKMWWFDSSGGVGEYLGNFTDENTLALEHRGKVEGRAFRERLSYTRVSPGVVRTKIEQAWDDEPYTPFLEATARRMGPDARRPRP